MYTREIDRAMQALLASGEHIRPKDFRAADRWRHAAHLALGKVILMMLLSFVCRTSIVTIAVRI